MKKKIPELITYVIALTKDVPEEFRKSSFEVLLNYYLTQQTFSSRPTPAKKSSDSAVSNAKVVSDIRKKDYDWLPTGIKKLEGISQYLKILSVAKNDFGINELYISDIMMILEEKFRVKKTFSAVSMVLMKSVGKYVDRVKSSKGYKYRITVSGQDRLKKINAGGK